MKDKIETCGLCVRKLKTERIIELGFGTVCYTRGVFVKEVIDLQKNNLLELDIMEIPSS